MRKRKKSLTMKIYNRLYWAFHEFLWLVPKKLRAYIIGPTDSVGITVAISTYIERFDDCFKSTLRKLQEFFPRDQIIVVANGHFDQARQQVYLKELREFCSKFTNVELIDFIDPVSTCKMTNSYFIKAQSEKILFLNDDSRYTLWFRKEINKSGILSEDWAIINGTWGLSLRSKIVIRKIGFFDERLPELGGEDDDYAARCAMEGLEIPYYVIRSVSNLHRKNKKRNLLNSWGKDMSQQKGGYSTLNYNFLHHQKWETSNEPFEGAIFVPRRNPKYWKLRPGMEAPNFYPTIKL